MNIGLGLSTGILAEVEPHVKDQIAKTDLIGVIGKDNIFLKQPVIGASLSESIKVANKWLENITKETSE